MKRVTSIAAAVVFAVVALLATNVLAQETNVQERSFITFSNTVEMPGVTLPAGTYVFRLADTPQRNVVQVLSQDEKKVLGQWLFVQAERPEVTDDTVIMFKENAANTMPAIQYWYFPGEKIGKEFVYPKNQATQIAARTGQKVRTEEGYVTPESANASNQPQPSSNVASNNDTTASNSSGKVANNDAGTVNGPGLAGIQQQGQSSANVSSDTDRTLSQAPAHQDQDRHEGVGTSGANAQNTKPVGTSGRLPKTASSLPLAGLIGLLSLAGALGFRKFAAAQDY